MIMVVKYDCDICEGYCRCKSIEDLVSEVPKISDITLYDIKRGKGTKDDIGKANYLDILKYLNLDFLSDSAEVMLNGAKKYSFENWKKDLEPDRIEKALLRHLVKYVNGEKLDKESNKSHLCHILCNAMFLYYYDHLEVSKNE